MSARKRRQAGPMSAAGLISFYEELEGRIRMGPVTVLAIAVAFSLLVIAAHILLP